MKNLLFLFSFVLVASLSANAQCNKSASAGKACCASKKAASVSTADDQTKVASVVMEADEVMKSSKGAITKRTCEISGATSYYQKSECATSGKISWEEVQFDAEKKSFTKVASASMEKDANGVKVEGKACAGKSEGKACCKKDGAKSCASKKAEGSK
ncbi:MAG: hypothetical protein WAT22_19485 [Saprospiraceae bacterium]|jgi:hypothetical protein|nr:hypothetical protein [Saprospiraceae bacterium]MBP6446610.1 hypothetical protein [Saprospiraceae bacterium]